MDTARFARQYDPEHDREPSQQFRLPRSERPQARSRPAPASPLSAAEPAFAILLRRCDGQRRAMIEFHEAAMPWTPHLHAAPRVGGTHPTLAVLATGAVVR